MSIEDSVIYAGTIYNNQCWSIGLGWSDLSQNSLTQNSCKLIMNADFNRLSGMIMDETKIFFHPEISAQAAEAAVTGRI